jgi:sugar lactone lactonase YvrE
MFRLTTIACLVAVLFAVPLTVLAQDLTETYTTLDGTLTFNYPGGWVTQEEFGSILLANSEETMNALMEVGEMSAGQAAIVVLPPAALEAQFGMIGLALDQGPAVVADEYIALVGEESFGEPEEVTIGGKPAVRVTGDLGGQAQTLYVVDLGEGGLAMVAVAAAPDELGQAQATSEAVIATMDAKPIPAPTETGSIVWQQVFEVNEEAMMSGGYDQLTAVVAGPDDTLYVADGVVGIHVFEADGTERETIRLQDFFGFINDLAIDPNGGLWVVDFSGGVTQVNPDGSLGASISLSESGDMFSFGVRLTAGPDGNLYVLAPVTNPEDESQSGEVMVIDPTGQVLRSFTVGSDEFYYEADLAFGPDGNLYVLELYGESGVKVFDTEGNLLREGLGAGSLFGGASALAVAADGSVFAAAPQSPIYHFAPDGVLLGRFGESQFSLADIDFDMEDFPTFEPGQFYEIGGVVALSNGDVVVVDSNPSFVQVVRIAFSE